MSWATITSIIKFIAKAWENTESIGYFEIINDFIFKNKKNWVNKEAYSWWKERSQSLNELNERKDEAFHWSSPGFKYFVAWTSSK
jgi:hypothetical protein